MLHQKQNQNSITMDKIHSLRYGERARACVHDMHAVLPAIVYAVLPMAVAVPNQRMDER